MTDYGINIIECYDIDYANPALFNERKLESPILMEKQNAQLFKKIGHTHNFFHYVYTVSSEGASIIINSQQYEMIPGVLYMVKPGILHEIIGDATYKMKLIEVKFFVKNENFLKIVKLLPDVMGDKDNKILNVLKELTSEYKTKAYNDDMAYIKIMEFFIILQRLFNSGAELHTLKINKYVKNQERFFPVLDYITEHFSTSITIDDLAGIVHMEKGYFIKQFKKCFNITPMNYIQAVRINRSLNLIEYTDMSIAKIAEEIGFLNQNSFIKAFKSLYSITPNDYRKKIRIDINKKNETK